MAKKLILIFLFNFSILPSNGQDSETYLKANAICFKNPEKLNDSIYNLLGPFQIIMVGEMHGTNESAPFISGLTSLFTNNGDSVLVGLEISVALMQKFTSLNSDSSIYQSDFFSNPPYLDGRESWAWANLIATLNKNKKVKLFFFDTNRDNNIISFRDSLMAMNIKTKISEYPTWKTITLSGNYHNKISDSNTMASILKRYVSKNVCALNIEYKEGSANANFGHGLEVKPLASFPSVFNSTIGYDQYLLLYPSNSKHDYNGIYFTKTISPSKMVSTK